MPPAPRFTWPPAWPFPPRGALLVALLALYLLPGLTGHDPWKSDDATHFGIAFAMGESARWWLPQLAGADVPDAYPLYYWVALASGRLLGWLMPLHDASRLASGLFAAGLLAGMALLSGRLHGRDTGALAALLTIGCLGLLVHIHDSQPAVALLACLAFALYGLALIAQRPWRGALVAGVAGGLGFLAAGWLAAGLLLPLLILLPLAAPAWRGGRALAGLGGSLALAAGVAAAWPLLLAAAGPEHFSNWLQASQSELATLRPSLARLWAYLSLLPWFAWPVLPLALWSLWRSRRALTEPAIALPLAAFAVFLPVLAAFDDARSLTALPLLLPLIALAVPGAGSLRRGAANAFDWFAMMSFSLAAALVWLGWVAMVSGWPPRIARNFARIEPGFVMPLMAGALLFAVLVSLGWLWLIVASPRSPLRGSLTWAAGVVTLWCLVSSLWLPWIDYGKSYRPVALALKRALPADHGCLAADNVGTAQLASLHYFAGLLTVPAGTASADNCPLLLIQASGRNPELSPGSQWRKIWDGRRSGDRDEIFRLYWRQ